MLIMWGHKWYLLNWLIPEVIRGMLLFMTFDYSQTFVQAADKGQYVNDINLHYTNKNRDLESP